MRIAEKDAGKTGFILKFGHFEFTVVPFGLTNASGAFMQMMDNVVKNFLKKFFMAYLDGILVYRKTWDEHFQNVGKVY